MAPEKDNSFQPNLTPRLNSAENIAPSGEFLQPVEGLSEAVSPKETSDFTEIEHPVVDQTIFAENGQVQHLASPQTIISTNPMAEYLHLTQGNQSPHNTVARLNQIRKAA